MAVPSMTNAQGQVSVIQMQWSPEAGDNGTFDQADYPETELIRPESFSVSMTTLFGSLCFVTFTLTMCQISLY